MKELTLQKVKNILEKNLRVADFNNTEFSDPTDQTSNPATRSKKSESVVSTWLMNQIKVVDEENNVLMWNPANGLEALCNGLAQTLFDLITDSDSNTADKTSVRGLKTRTIKADGPPEEALSGHTYRGGDKTDGSGNIWFEVPAGKTVNLKVGNFHIEVKDSQAEIKDGTNSIKLNGSQVNINGNFTVDP